MNRRRPEDFLRQFALSPIDFFAKKRAASPVTFSAQRPVSSWEGHTRKTPQQIQKPSRRALKTNE
jgi:hypothetical protein